eukprot:SAG22_NODE_631_length_8376_cov_43.396037_8_plen_199_part_00
MVSSTVLSEAVPVAWHVRVEGAAALDLLVSLRFGLLAAAPSGKTRYSCTMILFQGMSCTAVSTVQYRYSSACSSAINFWTCVRDTVSSEGHIACHTVTPHQGRPRCAHIKGDLTRGAGSETAWPGVLTRTRKWVPFCARYGFWAMDLRAAVKKHQGEGSRKAGKLAVSTYRVVITARRPPSAQPTSPSSKQTLLRKQA